MNISRYWLPGILGLLALIWLYPFAPEPSSVVSAQLFAAGCVALAGLLVVNHQVPRVIAWSVVLWLLLIGFRPSVYLDSTIFAVAAAGVVVASSAIGSAGVCNPSILRTLALALLAAAVLSAMAALLQYLGLAGGVWPWVAEVLERGHAVGNLRQPNLLATLLCCGVVAVVWLVKKDSLTEGMGWVAISLLHLATAASASRIGAIEVLFLAVLGLVWGAHHGNGNRRLLIGQFLVYVAAAQLVPWIAALHGIEVRTVAGRLSAAAQDSRWVLWSNMIDLVRERPWFGWGWHELGYAHFLLDASPRFGTLLDNAHNLPLQLAVEFGLPVALALCGVMLWAVVRAKPWQEADATRQFAWSLLALIGLHSLVEFPLWTVGFLCYSAIAVGILSSGPMTQKRSLPSWVLVLACSGLLTFCVLAWTQYQRVADIYQLSFKHMPQAKLKAIERARNHWLGKWLFVGHVDYAELTTITTTQQNAQKVRGLSEKLLHFSAEPRVIIAAITSAAYQQDWVTVERYAQKFCAAFPSGYKNWWIGAQSTEIGAILLPHLPECKSINQNSIH